MSSRITVELGVRVETLRNWVKQEQIDESKPITLTIEEKEELRRLRCEMKILSQEKEILTKNDCLFRQRGDRG